MGFNSAFKGLISAKKTVGPSAGEEEMGKPRTTETRGGKSATFCLSNLTYSFYCLLYQARVLMKA